MTSSVPPPPPQAIESCTPALALPLDAGPGRRRTFATVLLELKLDDTSCPGHAFAELVNVLFAGPLCGSVTVRSSTMPLASRWNLPEALDAPATPRQRAGAGSMSTTR